MNILDLVWNLDEAHLPVLMRKLRNPAPAQLDLPKPLPQQAANASFDYARYYNEYFTSQYSTDPKVLVLPIQGELTRNSYWTFGYEFLAKQLRSAATDDQYMGAVLKLNTPGGSADGCPVLAEAVAQFPKPILSWTNYCASAGVFAASGSDEIWMEDSATARFGSIGTLLIYENWVKYLEKEGIAMTIFRADGSPDKALVNAYEELPEQGKQEIMAMVNAARKEFVGYVKRGRSSVSSEALTGKMYGPRDAIRLGLVDKTGTLDGAVKRVLQLAKAS